MVLTATILLFSGVQAKPTAWTAVEKLFNELQSTVVYEFVNANVIVPTFDQKLEKSERLRIAANVMDRTFVEKDNAMVLSAKWVPHEMRRLDPLRNWSAKNRKKVEGISKLGETWIFSLKAGVSVTLTELRDAKVVSFDLATPWLVEPRFIIRSAGITSKSLLQILVSALGGQIKDVNGKTVLSIDGESFKRRRLLLAQEQLRRYPGPFPKDRTTSREYEFNTSLIERECLKVTTTNTIEEVFNNPESVLEVAGTSSFSLQAAISAQHDFATRAINGTKVKIAFPPTYYGEIWGNGNVCGAALLENGTKWHF